MALGKGTKIVAIAVIVVVIAIVSYSLFPYAVSTKVSDLNLDQTAYLYGTIQDRIVIGNISAFSLNDGSGTVTVIWNGTVPAIGEKVLVHGTYKQNGFVFKVFEATSVTYWPI